MSDIDFDDIRRLDGGLLLVFRELLVRRRATEVALRLGLSQSAVSHALARLRDLFGDPLFIRKSHGLEPTQRALALGPRIEALIELASATLSPEGQFDARHSRRRFQIAGPDFVSALFGGGLCEAFASEAPDAAFVCRRLLVDLALSAVRRGEIDVALGQFGRLPPGLTSEVVYEDQYCVVARRGHPRLDGRIDMAAYLALPHVVVGAADGVSDETAYAPEALASAYGPMPDASAMRILAYVPRWETAMSMVAASDAIAECPGRMADRYAEAFGLQILTPPYRVIRFPMQMVRRAGTADAGVDWLTAHLRRLLTSGAGNP